MRRIILDTETTGFYKHDRIIEVGAVEIVNGKIEDRLNYYINPGAAVFIGADATRVHGITRDMLKDKPDFAQVMQEFLELITGAQLIFHNAPFDTYYLNFELALCALRQGGEYKPMKDFCHEVIDTLIIAREKFPGQQNSLDALIARFGVDASARAQRHGALIDARLLAEIYQAMCVTQSSFELEAEMRRTASGALEEEIDIRALGDLTLIQPNAAEKEAHTSLMTRLKESS